MNDLNEISNLDFPIAKVIRDTLHNVPDVKRKDLLEAMSEDEFIIHRVDIYLKEFEAAMHCGFDELGVRELALKACLEGITDGNA